MTSPTAQRLYDSLPEFYRLADPDTGNTLLSFVRALVEGMGVADAEEDIARLPEALLDPQAADTPIAWVEWLAQLLGVQFNAAFDDTRKRLAVSGATSGWRSGTIPALEDAVRAGIRPHHADGTYMLTEGTGYATAPTSAAPGDIDLRVRTDGHHGTDETIFSLFNAGAGIRLRAVVGDGTVALDVGGATATSSVDVPQGQFDVSWVRAVTADSGADKVVTFYTAPDAPESQRLWTQLGTPVTLVGAAGAIDYTGVTEAGVAGPTPVHGGSRFVEAILLDGEDGPEVLRFDARGGSVTGDHVWTLSGDATIDQYPEEPYVEIIRHYLGDPWVIGVVTSRKESPSDTSIVAAAIEEARSRPAGFDVVFVDYAADWATIESARPTWADWEAANTWSDIRSTT